MLCVLQGALVFCMKKSSDFTKKVYKLSKNSNTAPCRKTRCGTFWERNSMNLDCPCKRNKCERHGKCDEYRAHHRQKSGKKALTKCEKIRLKEKK